MPAARCNECAAHVAFYLHAGRKLTEIACPCGGALTCAPWTWCRECDRNGHHRKDPENPKRKLCDRCIDGEKIGYRYYRSSTTGPSVTMSKKPLANESDWELRRESDEAIHYHVSGHWIAKRVTPEDAPRKLYRAFYIGPDRPGPNEFPKRRKLHLAQIDALSAIRNEELRKNPREHAFVAQQAGDSALMLECVFDYIDEKFRKLESDLSDS